MLKTVLAAAALAVGIALPSAFAAPAPSAAGPITLDVSANVDVTDVHYRGGHRHGHRRGYRNPYHGGRHYGRGHYRPRSGFSVQLEFGTPRYREVPRYRHVPRHVPQASYGGRHHAWCEGKYRSYSRYDGTYQPYHGPRRRCNSPYDGI